MGKISIPVCDNIPVYLLTDLKTREKCGLNFYEDPSQRWYGLNLPAY